MDKQQLSERLEALLTQDRPLEDKVYIKLLQQVWEVDWTVAPYEVWTHMMEWDIPYFLRFMGMDEGDEEREEQLIQDWIASRTQLRVKSTEPGWRQRVASLIDEMNYVRIAIRQDS